MSAPPGRVDAAGYSGSAPRVVGSKGAAGAWQQIVSILPAHRVFIETFAGGAALTRHKRPAELTLLIEFNGETAAALRAAMTDRQTVAVVNANALDVLDLAALPADVVVYCDPPYVRSTRKCQRDYYSWEWTDEDHEYFLAWVLRASCPVVVSGYWSAIYETRLSGWRHSSFTVGTRRGRATEHVWCNFPETAALHDAGHVGAGFTDRQRIKRKAARWVRMLAAMPAAERAAVLAAIRAAAPPPASMKARVDTDD
jgi:site-specific DNA-adenine methylase